MKPTTKSIVSGMVLVIGALVVAAQAWSVGNLWWDIFHERYDLISPFWPVERALFTALAFYSSVAIVRVIHRQRTSILCLFGVIALGLCFTVLIYRTLWGLPTFVGLHLVALGWVLIRYSISWFHPLPAPLNTVRNA